MSTNTILNTALLEAVAYVVPLVLAGIGWLYRETIGEWWRDTRRRRKAAKQRRIEQAQLPGMVKQMLERTEKLATDKAAADAALNEHKTNTTGQFQAIGQQLEALSTLEPAIKGVHLSVNLLHLRMGARADHSKAAECDFAPDFRMTSVNATLARRLGVGKSELLGFGYLGFIIQADMSAFRQEWTLCAAEHRPFQGVLRWRRPVDGVVLRMQWVLTPIPEPPATPIQQWLGVGEFELDEDDDA